MFSSILVMVVVFLPIAGAMLCYLTGRKSKTLRDGAVWTIVILELLFFVMLLMTGGATEEGTIVKIEGICGFGLQFTMDGFRLIQGIIMAFLWIVATVFSKEYRKGKHNSNRYYFFLLLTLGASAGVFLSADLFTTFLFFEMMSFTSFVWVAQEETKEALKASKIYLAIAVIGGMVMLMGIFLIYYLLGTLTYSELSFAQLRNLSLLSSNLSSEYFMNGTTLMMIAALCLFFGFGAKAGIFALHVWMPDSYSQAPAPESALLSGILSKTGLFGIIMVSANLFTNSVKNGMFLEISGTSLFGVPIHIPWGSFIVMAGLLTMLVGAVLAVFSVHLKRILAFSSMSQIGFMLIGIGMCTLLSEEGALAARGTVLHMFNHSMIKLILFVAAGIIFMNLGKLDLNEIRGYGRKKPFLNAMVLISALGIGGIPLFNGYVSKTLLHESILEGIHAGVLDGVFLPVVERLFLLSGGCTVAYMAKIYIAIFIEKNKEAKVQEQYDEKTSYVSLPVKILLGIAAASMVVIGVLPNLTADRIGDMTAGIMGVPALQEQIAYFSFENLKGAMISIAAGIVIYIGIIRICLMDSEKNYKDYWPKWLNLWDLVYHPLVFVVFPAVGGFFSRLADSLVDNLVVLCRKTFMKDTPLPYELEEGTRMTYAMGTVADFVMKYYYRITHRRKKDSVSYVHKYAVKYTEFMESNVIIARSLSFALLLFCIGLSLTLIYVLFW